MRLVKDNPRPHPFVHQSGTSERPLIVHHVQVLRRGTEILGKIPFLFARVTPPHTEPAALCYLLPLVKDTEGREEKICGRLGLFDETQHLNRLTQAHFVTQNATAVTQSLTL
jgi:hypothetical protein